MKQFILKKRKAFTGLAAILLIGGITMSFQDTPMIYSRFDSGVQVFDTIPDKTEDGSMKMKDFDNLMGELDKAILQVGEGLGKIDFAKIQDDVERSLKSVDIDKIMKDVELSLKDIDLNKIMAEVRTSMKDIDWKKHEAEISKALLEAEKEMDLARNEIRNIDKDKIRKEVENARTEIEKSKSEFKKLDIGKIMQEAREGIEKGKEELRLTKAMFTEMEKDGLISSKDGFSIEYKDKELYINGNKQDERTTDRYRKYFTQDHFKIRIDKD